MTQPDPPPSQSNQISQSPQPSQLQTSWGRYTEEFLEKLSEPVDLIGRRLMGDLWRTFYLTVQDAIVLSLILQIPGLIVQWILGKSFSSFDVCLKENPLGVNRYACFVIVTSDFLLWIVLAGRILGRFLADLSQLKKPQ